MITGVTLYIILYTDLIWRQRGVEGDVGEGIHYGDQRAGDGDGTGQVPHGVLQLLDDEVQVVPGGKENRFILRPVVLFSKDTSLRSPMQTRQK